jgi:hypothetical protein
VAAEQGRNIREFAPLSGVKNWLIACTSGELGLV